MPHIHLETTTNIPENSEIPQILATLVQVLSDCQTIESPSVKAYHTLRPVWAMGEGGANGFVHCTVMILTGRPLELRQEISDKIAESLRRAFFESLATGEASFTVEIREMDRATYFK